MIIYIHTYIVSVIIIYWILKLYGKYLITLEIIIKYYNHNKIFIYYDLFC